ncbi:hypothetical protein D3C72_1003080 [compost metagenome]
MPVHNEKQQGAKGVNNLRNHGGRAAVDWVVHHRHPKAHIHRKNMSGGLQGDKHQMHRHAKQHAPQHLLSDEQKGTHRQQPGEQHFFRQHRGDNHRQRQRERRFDAFAKGAVIQHRAKVDKRQNAHKRQNERHQRVYQSENINAHGRQPTSAAAW